MSTVRKFGPPPITFTRTGGQTWERVTNTVPRGAIIISQMMMANADVALAFQAGPQGAANTTVYSGYSTSYTAPLSTGSSDNAVMSLKVARAYFPEIWVQDGSNAGNAATWKFNFIL